MAKSEKTDTTDSLVENTSNQLAQGSTTQSVVVKSAEPDKPKKPLTALVVVARVSGMGQPLAEKLVGKMKDDEKSSLVEAYEKNANPRGVLQKIRDRIADEHIAKKAEEK